MKVAVWGNKAKEIPAYFDIIEAGTEKVVFKSSNIKLLGAYGPFTKTARRNFSVLKLRVAFILRQMVFYLPWYLLMIRFRRRR